MSLATTVAERLFRLDLLPRCILLDRNLPVGGCASVLLEVRRRLPGTLVADCSGSTNLAQLAEVRGLRTE